MSMTWKNIRLILMKEIRDQIRDRRTLFLVLVLPLILYPGLSLGMLEMAMLFNEQSQVVVMLGADQLPEVPLIENGRFADKWFFKAETAQRLFVITDSNTFKDASDLDLLTGTKVKKDEALAAAQRLRTLTQRRVDLVHQLAPFDEKLAEEIGLKFETAVAPDGSEAVKVDDSEKKLWRGVNRPWSTQKPDNFDELQSELKDVRAQLTDEFLKSKLQVLVLIPENYGQTLAEIDRLLAAKDFSSDALHELPMLQPLVVRNRASDKSELAFRRVREALDHWERHILESRLQGAHLPLTVADPVNAISVDIANNEEVAANVWSKIIPALLVIMALTGAFYPAIDVAAGEKERGTMETLLICPATRSEIVLGKFLTVLLFSMTTTVLNLISMGSTSRYIVSVTQAATATSKLGDVPLPNVMSVLWMVLLLIPLAGLFSALCVALATFARSNKEGQHYLTPLFMVTIGLTMFSMSPSVELSPTAGTSFFYCAMPVVGPALLLKAMLVNPNDPEPLVFALPVLMSSMAYGMLALWWAVEQFKSEDVLFREAERFELKLWLHQMLRDKEVLPGTSEAAACFVLMMLLQFLSINVFGKSLSTVAAEDLGQHVMKLAVIQQLALIASPAIFMALLLTKSARQTLRLNWPKWTYLGAAILLPLVLHPLANELLTSLKNYFPQLPDSAKAAFATMADDKLPLAFIIGAFALAPALCEEVAFRGFILSGLGRGGRVGVAIVLSSVTFGIIHMIPQQVFNASLLGLVLGLLAVRSNSLLPGVVFHFCFNSLQVVQAQLTTQWHDSLPTEGTGTWFLALNGGALRYGPVTLFVCATIAVLVIRWLIRDGKSSDEDQWQLPAANSTYSPVTPGAR